ncbi:MAG: phosphotransferase family protein [Myxococcota bacterium]
MPAPVGRDLELMRKRLVEWFGGLLPAARDLEIGELTGPGATGFSSDTLIFDLTYTETGRSVSRGLVARIQPSGFQVFPEYDLPAQYEIMKALEATDVAVPKMLWEEWTGDVIGDAFYVMERVDGNTPADNPPYTAEGFLKEMSPRDQSTLWRGYIETLAAIHRLDPFELGLGGLAMPELGATPIEQELRFYDDFYRWAYPEGQHPVVEPSLEWLRANRPPMPERIGLSWGDSRIGNMIFSGTKCVAVIDWEMARLGDPVMDLAWGLFVGRYHAEGTGNPTIPGFLSRDESIAMYEELVGRSAEHLAYYEILAGMRFSVILIRLAKQLKHHGLLPEDVNFEIDNPVSNLHRLQLQEIGVL